MTVTSPPYSPLIPSSSSCLSLPIYPSSIITQKGTDLLCMPAKHDLSSCHKTKHLPLYSDWARQSSWGIGAKETIEAPTPISIPIARNPLHIDQTTQKSHLCRGPRCFCMCSFVVDSDSLSSHESEEWFVWALLQCSWTVLYKTSWWFEKQIF